VSTVQGAEHLDEEIRRTLDATRHDPGWSPRQDDEDVWLYRISPWKEDIDRRSAPPSSQILYQRHEEANQRRNYQRMRGAG
jgi:hypothetical protein